ncbi:Stf0 sulfotransferase [Cellulomonas flavigena DSM 20109]|uniref:Trehalose 2-sulfotransferase n=1 Tax=Cellulomonas flavigena (strain ATCC 482 / DSM 20109 / BCRC 11376 / JCM 18109 / NBRC 3775 / NCIMB 8073 / NRS 134) TaxID=446466 RepID=D5UDK3_CELFN|nr:Stf0 sulfotransferase [Cellulomonas flavigena]ADG76459.1 Stf0 sulfotransferase [Cellulomonas flavigena DSM 20109]
MPGPVAAYVVACQERTGSNLLCGALSAQGGLGAPDEWLGRSRLHQRLVDSGTAAPSSTPGAPRPGDLDAYVDAMAARTAPGAVFGAKVHWYQLAAALDDGWLDDVRGAVPRAARSDAVVVRLRRRDRVAQAVSMLRAQATGTYVAPADGSAVDEVRHPEPYWATGGGDPLEEIERVVGTIDAHDARWSQHLAALDVPVLEVDYEWLTADYDATVRDVLAFLDHPLPATAAVPEPRTARQADARSAELIEAYRRSRRS